MGEKKVTEKKNTSSGYDVSNEYWKVLFVYSMFLTFTWDEYIYREIQMNPKYKHMTRYVNLTKTKSIYVVVARHTCDK